MTKYRLNDAQRDSHRATMNIHLETAERLIKSGEFSAAKTALELAWPHANATGEYQSKSKVFGALNRVRSALRNRETASA